MTRVFITALMVITFFCCNNYIIAAPQQYETSQDNLRLILKKAPKDPSKKVPDSPDFDCQLVTCSYYDGVITLTFAEPEGICRGSITDVTNGKIQLITFDSSELNIEIEIGNLGDFYIEFSTEKWNIYSGSTLIF